LFSGSDITAILFLIALLFGFLFVLSYNKIIKFPDSKKVLEEKKEIQIISKEIIHNLMEKAELELTQIKIQTQSYVDAFGNISKEIKLLEYPPKYNSEDVINKILVFESSSKIIIQKNVFSFADILAFELKDEEQILYTSTVSTSTSSTSTGSILGRAVVGGVLLGGVGAVLGGTTAKKKISTINSPQQTSVKHHYIAHIIVNSFSNPQIIIGLKGNALVANEIAAIFTVILERNRSNK